MTPPLGLPFSLLLFVPGCPGTGILSVCLARSMMRLLANASVLPFHTYRSTRLPSVGTSEMTFVSEPVLLCVHRTYMDGFVGKLGCSTRLSNPRSDAEFTARSSTAVGWITPL